jgi:peroxiredoxin
VTPPAGALGSGGGAAPRKPRIAFLVVGCLVAAGLALGLFVGVGSPSSGPAPVVGATAPPFSLASVAGSGKVALPGADGGRPTVVLFFGNWCPECHSELPPLAAQVARQGHGDLASVRVVGVDSLDSRGSARSFTRASGVTFPVGWDGSSAVTNGAYHFIGDPQAVFIASSGRIVAIHPGRLTPAGLAAAERRLLKG